MADFAEFRVTRSRGGNIESVVWDPPRSGGPYFDLAGMEIAEIERTITEGGGVPKVRVTFVARLVEVEAEGS